MGPGSEAARKVLHAVLEHTHVMVNIFRVGSTDRAGFVLFLSTML
jgi:hypothetical protein